MEVTSWVVKGHRYGQTGVALPGWIGELFQTQCAPNHILRPHLERRRMSRPARVGVILSGGIGANSLSITLIPATTTRGTAGGDDPVTLSTV